MNTVEMVLMAVVMGLGGLITGVVLAQQILGLLLQLKGAVVGLVAQVKSLFSKTPPSQ